MAGVIASKVRKQRSALKADTSRDAETQNNYLNVGNVSVSLQFFLPRNKTKLLWYLIDKYCCEMDQDESFRVGLPLLKILGQSL